MSPASNGQVYRAAIRIIGSTLQAMANGTVSAPVTLAAVPAGLKNLTIGAPADQHIQSLVVIPSAISDANFAGLLA